MSQDLFRVFPIPVLLALAALVVILVGLTRVLASLGRPVQLHAPQGVEGAHEPHAPTDTSGHELRTH
jgi:hypothetical protein